MATNITARLSSLRKEKGLSQKEAAAGLGVSQALLSHYENGIRECGLDFLCRAADYYNVTTDYLLGLSESKRGFEGAVRHQRRPALRLGAQHINYIPRRRKAAQISDFPAGAQRLNY